MNNISRHINILPRGLISILPLMLTACMTMPLEVSYTSFAKQSFSERSQPAKKYQGTVDELLTGEYLLIGFIDVRRNIKKCFEGEACSQITEKFPTVADVQNEAAKNGGDVVLVLDKKFIVERVTKQICTNYYTYTYTIEGKTYTNTSCSAYMTKYGTLESTINRALVWRYTPNKNNLDANTAAIADAMKTLAETYELDKKKNENYLVSNQLETGKQKNKVEKNDSEEEKIKRNKENLAWQFAQIAKMSDQDIKKNCIKWLEKTFNDEFKINITMLSLGVEAYDAALKLIENDCGLGHVDNKGSNLLIYVLKYGNLAVYKALVSKRDSLGETTYDMLPEIFYAATNRNPEIVNYFIDSGKNVNTTLDNGLTPIYMTIFKGNLDTFESLLKRKANVHARLKNGFTTIMAAASYDQPQLITRLVELGVDINARDNSNKNALVLAAYDNKLKSVARLLELGIENQQNAEGMSLAFEIAKLYDRHHAVQAIVTYEKKVYLDEEEFVGYLSRLAYHNFPDVMVTLLNNWHSKLSVSNLSRITHNAASYNYGDVIRVIGRKWKDLNFLDQYGNTPLMIAAINNNEDAVRALLEVHVDTTIKSEYGKTAYQIAVDNGADKVVEVMRSNNVFE